MIKLDKMKKGLRIIGFMIGAGVLSSCTATVGYWGTDTTYGYGDADFFYVGSGYNNWDRNYYNYGWGRYNYNRAGWGGHRYYRAGYGRGYGHGYHHGGHHGRR